MTVPSASPVELVSADVSPNETIVCRELAASLSHTGLGLSDGLLSSGFGDVEAVSAIYPDPQRGPVLSDVVLSGSTPGPSMSSRDTCVPSVVAQVRQRSDPDSGGVGLHSNLRGLSDVSLALSTSTGVCVESTSVGALSGDFDAVSTVGHVAPTDGTSLTLVSKCF